ncbi:MAG: hypothetical protein ACOZIN_21810 [Myxococcota bacterium]
MLNRHAIVLYLGLAALLLLRAPPGGSLATLGAAFIVLVGGLLLDAGEPGSPRTAAAHLLQATAVVMLLFTAVRHLVIDGTSSLHLVLAEGGIAVASLGVLLEMRLSYAALRKGVAVQAAGDGLYLAAVGVSLVGRTETPSTIGWVFIAIAGLLGLYAAVTNLLLQFGRLKNPQAGWRFRVLELNETALRLKTPGGESRIELRHIESVKRLDERHLLLVLPSPLPPELKTSGLPFEELREGAEPVISETAPPPARYGFILHEQELGRALTDAEAVLQKNPTH